MKVNPMATLDNPGPGSYDVAGRGLDTGTVVLDLALLFLWMM